MRLRAMLLGLLAACVAQASAQEAGPLSGPDATEARVALVPWATIVKDETGSRPAADLNGLARPDKPRIDQEVFSPGYSASAYWLIVPLRNTQPAPLARLLVFDPSWLDDLRITLTDAQGEVQTFFGGDTRPFEQRSAPHRLSNFALTLPPGTSTLAVRVATRDPFFLSMTLMSREAFNEFAGRESLYFGFLYGGLLSLLLFNFVLSLSARERTYLAYCVWLMAFLAMHATYNGHVFRWLQPESPALANWTHSVFIYLYCFCGLVFALVFLDLKEKLPRAYLWTRRLLYVLAISFAATAVLGGYRAQVVSSIIWVVVFSAAAFMLGLLSLRKRNAAASFYLSGSMAGLVGSSITAFTVMGFLPYSFTTFRAVDFGLLLDAIMLSLALSARVGQARRLERLRRFFSPAVADQLLSATSQELYRPHQREIVVLFLDLRGYTAFTLKHGAEEVMRVLGEFHAAMGELIAFHEATLERFAGDGMMIFLNDPIRIADPAGKAAQMALQMQARFLELNRTWEPRGYSLSMGVGIAQGIATIGAIGFEGRRDYAAIGTVTNLAARLCAEARAGQILVSSVVAGNIEKTVQVRAAGNLALKGFSEPVACYEIAPLPGMQAIGKEPLAAAAAG